MSLTVYSERSFTSVSSTWQDIKGAMTKQLPHAPTKRTPASHTHHWVDTWLQRATRRKNSAIHKDKQTKNPIDWDRKKRWRKQTHKDLRSAHKKYMEEVVSALVIHQCKQQESIGVVPLKNKDEIIHSDSSSKMEILNEQFVSAYTREEKSNIQRKGPIRIKSKNKTPSQHPTMGSIRVHFKSVLKLFRDLKTYIK